MSASRKHRVEQGECLASLAHQAGLLRKHIWTDAANERLRDDRDPFLLKPGDVLTIPAPDLKSESRASERRHRFRRIVEPTKLHIRMLENREPRADIEWALLCDGRIIAEGRTTAEGDIETNIDPLLMDLTLRFGPDDKLEQYRLRVGSLNPLETVGGVQARLTNLGIYPGPVDNIFGPLTESAVRIFQNEHDLDTDGQINNATRSALLDAYGC